MSLSFARIAVGSIWDRNALAELWGYRSFHALARGVFTPAGDNKIVLFVTEQKQESQTPYTDRLEGGQRLFWEGEKGHRTDERIASAGRKAEEIHVFIARGIMNRSAT